MKPTTVLLLFISIIIYSCTQKSIIYSNRSFEAISLLAKEQNKPFCITLIDTNQHLTREYTSSLSKKYSFLTNKAIYNIVNVTDLNNNWYIKWLSPISIPLTCVFTPMGRLIDIIPGATKESFLYTEKAIIQMNTSDFHWPNRFQIQKKEITSILNGILEQKNHISEGIYLSSDIDSLLNLLNYPYLIYLKLSGELLTNDTTAVQTTSNQLLKLETPYNIDTYKNEFLIAKKLVDPHFNIENEPNIRISKQIIQIGTCVKGKTIPTKITLYNDGKKQLNIARIITSCSCIKNLNKANSLSLAPKDSLTLFFEFTPDTEGAISRSVLIASNAINYPFLYIHFFANSTF